MVKYCLIFFVIFILILSFPPRGLSQDFHWVTLANHIHSNISDGVYSLDQIVEMAREKQIDVLIVTDSALRQWEYGIWPWPNLVKRIITNNSSVITLGPAHYLSQIKRLNKINDDIIIIPGVEAAPFYYWEGSLFKNNLVLRDWHKHMLVIGLNQPEDYDNLPLLSNKARRVYSLKSLFKLWPLLFIILGLGLYKRRSKFSFSFILIGILFLINNFPFTDLGFDQYHGRRGIEPYQKLINYVNEKKGLTFWAHPETGYQAKIKGINIFTPAYYTDLLSAFNYTGFASLYSNYIEITKPNREWDSILKQYCAGKRKAPVWNISELDFRDTSNRINKNQTILFLKELNTAAVIEAIRNGHMYTRLNLNKKPDILEEFWLKDRYIDKKGYMGQEIVSRGKIIIKIKGKTAFQYPDFATLEIIRQGQLIKTIDLSNGEFDVTFEDEYSGQDKLIYYRIRITSPNSIIICNPIFVKLLKENI